LHGKKLAVSVISQSLVVLLLGTKEMLPLIRLSVCETRLTPVFRDESYTGSSHMISIIPENKLANICCLN